MIGLPSKGQHVKVWPFPGRQAQQDERPIDDLGGGRAIPAAGAVIVWSEFQHSQLLNGMIMLHAPPCEKHDFDDDDEACTLCGRSAVEAKEYDGHRDAGIKAAKEAHEKGLPRHSYEEAIERRAKKAAKQAELAAKGAAPDKPGKPGKKSE